MSDYAEYLKFCKERGYTPLPEADIFWRSNWAVRKNPGNYDDETA